MKKYTYRWGWGVIGSRGKLLENGDGGYRNRVVCKLSKLLISLTIVG